MKLLVLGGTEFVGRAVVDEALARGADVTVFNRGTHAPPAGVTALRGDRTAPDGLAALERIAPGGDVVAPAGVDVTGSDASLRWVDAATIVEAGVEPWTDLPIWVPPGELYDALHRADVSAAIAEGLDCRPIAQTVADTWSWLQELPGAAPQRPDRPVVGLAPDVEARVLSTRT